MEGEDEIEDLNEEKKDKKKATTRQAQMGTDKQEQTALASAAVGDHRGRVRRVLQVDHERLGEVSRGQAPPHPGRRRVHCLPLRAARRTTCSSLTRSISPAAFSSWTTTIDSFASGPTS
jgi:hypothetical protein